MKDMPAMGKRDYDISTSRTGDSGRDFLEQVLDDTQRTEITGILNQQSKAIRETKIEQREEAFAELKVLLQSA
jgi:hypothetical protein